MRRARKKLQESAPCGCGSGETYGQCCKAKGIIYEVSASGITTVVPVHPELKEAMSDAEERFQNIFGRKMTRGDLFLFDHFLSGEQDTWEAIRRMGKAANTPEELIFAWRRTGLIVAETNKHLIPDIDLAEWQEAIDEYFECVESDIDPFYLFSYLEPEEYEHYKYCVELLEHVIVAGFNAIRKSSIRRRDHFFQYLMICSSLNSFRTIYEMFKGRYDDDCLAVLRGIYEQYLRIKLLRLEPQHVVSFDASVHALVGMWPYKRRKNGSTDFSAVVDSESGREIRITFSNHSIAEKSDFPHELDIYYKLYRELSGHVHHDVAAWALKGMITKELGFDRDQDSVRAISLILFVSCFLLHEVGHLEWVQKRPRRDVVHVACTRFRRHRVRCFNGTGGRSWSGESLPGSSSLKLCG